MPVAFKVKIQKSGGSHQMVIPKPILDTAGWKIGDVVSVRLEDGDKVMTVKKQ